MPFDATSLESQGKIKLTHYIAERSVVRSLLHYQKTSLPHLLPLVDLDKDRDPMIVISGIERETRGTADKSLILSASWIDGLRFRYVISRSGIRVDGLEGKRPRRSALMIHSFSIAVHDDVWSLFLVQRFEPLLKTIHGIRHFLFHTDTQPLQREDIGTAFGVGNAREVAETLRGMGYRVNELRWVDILRTTANALQPAE